MADDPVPIPRSGSAALEHLTGPSRGKVTWLNESAVDLYLSSGRLIGVSPAQPGLPATGLIARLHRAADSYEIEVSDDCRVWVNGARVGTRRLENGDMIEFGETGPLSRFFLFGEDRPIHNTIADILSDGYVYLRVSRQPPATRVYRAVCGLLRRMARETTVLFRVTIVIAVFSLGILAIHQSRVNVMLQQRVEQGDARMERFAAAIAQAAEKALRASDLEALRQELGQRLSSAAERLAVLEERSEASTRVIAQSMSSVLFLQGSYGFRERSSKRMLRHVADDKGVPLVSPIGQPMLSLDGNGPVAEREFTGTGFAIGDDGLLITNRHVAVPWEDDTGVEVLAEQNLEPVLIKFIAYQPGKAEAVAVKLLKESKAADLAILKAADGAATIKGLKLADSPPRAGDAVIVMGYPTGLLSMLAQSGKAFIEKLQQAKDTGFWTVAARLAEGGHIMPLASRGIVGQATEATIVYDAETTHGGSGGPVLDLNGAVVAVNTAVLPEYGGSNLGVPAAKVRALLQEAVSR